MKRLCRIFIGYLAASLAAGFGVGFGMALQLTLDLDDINFPHGSVSGMLLQSVPVIFLWIAGCAFLPALTTIVVAERLGTRGHYYYAGMGAALGAVLPRAFDRQTEWDLSLIGIVVGPVAGWIYWRIAGRHAGSPQ